MRTGKYSDQTDGNLYTKLSDFASKSAEQQQKLKLSDWMILTAKPCGVCSSFSPGALVLFHLSLFAPSESRWWTERTDGELNTNLVHLLQLRHFASQTETQGLQAEKKKKKGWGAQTWSLSRGQMLQPESSHSSCSGTALNYLLCNEKTSISLRDGDQTWSNSSLQETINTSADDTCFQWTHKIFHKRENIRNMKIFGSLQWWWFFSMNKLAFITSGNQSDL